MSDAKARKALDRISDVERLTNVVAHRGDVWRASRANADLDRERLVAAVIDAYEAGVSEYTLTIEAGVTRSTVRTWLGK